MVSGEYVLRFYIEFLMNHHVVYSFGSAATPGQCGLPIWLPPASLLLQLQRKTHEVIWRCYPFTRGVIGGIQVPYELRALR